MTSHIPSATVAGKRVLAFVMAGGEGSRLHPLTQHRSKPSVPFNGRHRVVDFVLSNLVNSGIYSIYLLVQYKSQSLIEHIRRSWTMTPFIPQHFISVVPPQMQRGPDWFQGTADAVLQNLHLIDLVQPDLVAVFGADHVYRMDVRQMIEAHIAHRADASVAALPVPIEQCSQFGILQTDASQRIVRFDEKPAVAGPMPGRPGHALASIGNYLFDAELLRDVLRSAFDRGHSDFGKHILPTLARTHRVTAYDFATNHVPGVTAGEERAYWRDVGTIDAYFAANFDTLGVAPRFRIANPQWPIYAGGDPGESALVMGARMTDCSIGPGCRIHAALIERAILRRDVVVQDDVHLCEAIVMDYSVIGRGARLRRVIVDQHNRIPAGDRIGFDAARDRERGFHVSDDGVVVVARGQLR